MKKQNDDSKRILYNRGMVAMNAPGQATLPLFPARLEHLREFVSGAAEFLGDLADSVCAIADVVCMNIGDVGSSAASAANTGGIAHVIGAVISNASRWRKVQRREGTRLAEHVSIEN